MGYDGDIAALGGPERSLRLEALARVPRRPCLRSR